MTIVRRTRESTLGGEFENVLGGGERKSNIPSMTRRAPVDTTDERDNRM